MSLHWITISSQLHNNIFLAWMSRLRNWSSFDQSLPIIFTLRIVVEYPFPITRNNFKQKHLFHWSTIKYNKASIGVFCPFQSDHTKLPTHFLPSFWIFSIWWKRCKMAFWMTPSCFASSFWVCTVFWFNSCCNLSSWNFRKPSQRGQFLSLKSPFSNCSY